jgi:hypothetical protein
MLEILKMADNIEDKIAKLKVLASEYNKLSDQDKLKNIDQYNTLIKEKESCISILNDHKKSLAEIPIDHDSVVDIGALLNVINDIKNKLDDNNMKISEMISLHDKALISKSQLLKHFSDKQLEIVHLMPM